ncbi:MULTISPECIES: DUF2939 domain-containing protein [unclassified Psychrobacter]|uniref:DUF2939 domain-containing protein n=1 Tax=unclassified Psychrobacter TaxID=196806 RepID=UPI00071E87BD|nr:MULTISPECIES: DUF2939 domain-containing protein [unclassified Psychrobacter]OLF37425.1 hypothetical protein BTV98_07290 [Psychrobacter sp. Cmf 22.2]
MKKLMTLLILLVVIVVAIYAGSPYYSAYQLKNAYDDKDGATIAAAINYEQVRPSIKTQLTNRFADTMNQYPLVAELGGEPLAKAANSFIVQAVDSAITPQNVERLINTQGQANTATKELAAAWAISSNQIDLKNLIQDLIIHRGDVDIVVKQQVQQMMNQQAAQLEQQAAQGTDSDKPTLSYCGLNCFNISGQIKGYPITINMQREGFIEWKIVDVVLP